MKTERQKGLIVYSVEISTVNKMTFRQAAYRQANITIYFAEIHFTLMYNSCEQTILIQSEFLMHKETSVPH